MTTARGTPREDVGDPEQATNNAGRAAGSSVANNAGQDTPERALHIARRADR